MGLWTPPPAAFTAYQSNITSPTDAGGATLTASASANTKGAWATLIASLNFDVYQIDLRFQSSFIAATNNGRLVDIGIGAAAAESVIIPNLLAGYAPTYAAAGPTGIGINGQIYRFPLYVASGQRLSARVQAPTGSATVLVAVRVWGRPSRAGVWAGETVTDYGTSTATSTGVAVAAGLSSAEGAWTQIVASTGARHYYLAAGIDGAADTTVLTGAATLDLGVGAATEVAIAEDFYFASSTNESISQERPFDLYADIPAASRLAARISSGQGSAQSYGVALYGVS